MSSFESAAGNRAGENARTPRPALRASQWQIVGRTLEFGRRPMLMGILNVTPDSFSDAGQFVRIDAAVEHGRRLAAEGADLVDIGGESTRPYSEPVTAEEELRRVIPVIERLRPRLEIPISIDTSKAVVARQAIAAGAQIINDVTGLQLDPLMPAVAAETGAGVCAMHMQGTPLTMQDDPTYCDVVQEVFEYLGNRRDALVRAGIHLSRIALDPGIGFGKTHRHNIELAASCYRFHELGCPVLVGHSRKGFLAKITGDKQGDRTAGTIGAAISLANQGVQILRVHDVGPVFQALLVYEATGGLHDLT